MGRVLEDVSVIRVQNIEALVYSPITELFERAFNKSAATPDWSGPVAYEVAQAIANPDHGVFVGLEGAAPRSLAIVFATKSVLDLTPGVYLFYNEGKRRVFRQTVQAVVDFVREKGYDRFYALNGLTRNSTYARLFRNAGPMTPVASVVRFDVGSEDANGRTVRGQQV